MEFIYYIYSYIYILWLLSVAFFWSLVKLLWQGLGTVDCVTETNLYLQIFARLHICQISALEKKYEM